MAGPTLHVPAEAQAALRRYGRKPPHVNHVKVRSSYAITLGRYPVTPDATSLWSIVLAIISHDLLRTSGPAHHRTRRVDRSLNIAIVTCNVLLRLNLARINVRA